MKEGQRLQRKGRREGGKEEEGERKGESTCSEAEPVSEVSPASLASLPTLDILC